MRLKLREILVLMLVGLALSSWIPLTASGQSPQTVSVQMSKDAVSLFVGESVEFETVLRNNGTDATPPLVAHLNIASLRAGVYVDPEDWSTSRTRYLEPLQPGDSVTVDWKVRALSEGEFAAFVTLISADPSFFAVTGSPLQIHTEPSKILPMNRVIPVVAVVPLVPLALLLFRIAAARKRSAALRRLRDTQ
jgi:hypothetical protein